MDRPLLSITPEEEELFKVVLASLRFKGRSTIARVAGGWVRDKLLGRESDDIDIALDDQTGAECASSVLEYQSYLGNQVRSMAVIQANPEQSKHLETATTTLLGFSVDFVNLRAETYGDSRIPGNKCVCVCVYIYIYTYIDVLCICLIVEISAYLYTYQC